MTEERVVPAARSAAPITATRTAKSAAAARTSGADETNRAAEAIEAVGLDKSYGELRVLAGIDLSVARGEVYALLGPNGAGKTTTVRILATLTRADAGRARVAGFDIEHDRHMVRRHISLTGQYAAVDELQTGEENLRMMARLSGLARGTARARARELLRLFDLTQAARRRVSTYSGGMRRRLDLAAGLAGRPSVIFLDEPTTGLDPRSRQAIWDMVTELAAQGAAVLLTTQYLEEADRLADRVGVLDGGRLVAEGTPEDLKGRIGGGRLELVLVDERSYLDIAERLGGRVLQATPRTRTISVATDGNAAMIRGLMDEIDPHYRAISSFAVHGTTLDDVYLALTGHGARTGDDTKEHTDA